MGMLTSRRLTAVAVVCAVSFLGLPAVASATGARHPGVVALSGTTTAVAGPYAASPDTTVAFDDYKIVTADVSSVFSPTDINSDGLISGALAASSAPSGLTTAALLDIFSTPGSIKARILGAPSGDPSYATSVNDTGNAAGFAQTITSGLTTQGPALRWDSTDAHATPVAPVVFTTTEGGSGPQVDQSGAMSYANTASNLPGYRVGIASSSGATVDPNFGEPYAINGDYIAGWKLQQDGGNKVFAGGEVVDTSTSTAYAVPDMIQPSSEGTIFGAPGFHGLTDSGLWAYDSTNGQPEVFSVATGTSVPLSTNPVDCASPSDWPVRDMNDAGVAIGFERCGADRVGVMWKGDAVRGLASLLPTNSGFTSKDLFPVGIADNGDIVGLESTDGFATTKVFVMLPIKKLKISSITLSPKNPSSSDKVVTATVTVVNATPNDVTDMAITASSNTPATLGITGDPNPKSVDTVAAGANAKFTVALKPKKGGDASFKVNAVALNGTDPVTANAVNRTFAIDSGLELELTAKGSPDKDGKVTLRGLVTNTGLNAASGVHLTVKDVTGVAHLAKIGDPDPASFSLAKKESKSFTVHVKLPLSGTYKFSGVVAGKINGEKVVGSDDLTIKDDKDPFDIEVLPKFSPDQIGETGHVLIKITNNTNENIANLATSLVVAKTSGNGRAKIGTIPAPINLTKTAEVKIPVTLVYPGKLTYTATLTGTGARTLDDYRGHDSGDETIITPHLTAKHDSATQYKKAGMAERLVGKDWSTAGGPIDVTLQGTPLHTFSQRETYDLTAALDFWPNHKTYKPGKAAPDDACFAHFAATQGAYTDKIKATGHIDRILLFADAAPNLTTNMYLCDGDINYVKATPGTAVYVDARPGGGFTTLEVVQAAGHVASIAIKPNLDLCINLTDGSHKLKMTTKAHSNNVDFERSAGRCPKH